MDSVSDIDPPLLRRGRSYQPFFFPLILKMPFKIDSNEINFYTALQALLAA